MNIETDLKLSIGGFPPMSARNCHQTLWCQDLTKRRRTINGNLVTLGNLIKKYKTKIKGTDENILATGAYLTPGTRVEVTCLQRICEKIDFGTSKVLLSRPLEEKSLIFLTKAFDENLSFHKTIKNLLKRLVIEQECVLEFKSEIDLNKINKSLVMGSGENGEDNTFFCQKYFFVSYRPILNMVLINYELSTCERSSKSEWNLELEEV
jgi:hypothetical protein